MFAKFQVILLFFCSLLAVLTVPSILWVKWANGDFGSQEWFSCAVLMAFVFVLIRTSRIMALDILKLETAGPSDRGNSAPSLLERARQRPLPFVAVAGFAFSIPPIFLWSLGWLSIFHFAIAEIATLVALVSAWKAADRFLRNARRK